MDGASQIKLVPADHLGECSQQAAVQRLVGVQLKQWDGFEIEILWHLHLSTPPQTRSHSLTHRACPKRESLSQQQVIERLRAGVTGL